MRSKLLRVLLVFGQKIFLRRLIVLQIMSFMYFLGHALIDVCALNELGLLRVVALLFCQVLVRIY